VRALRQSSPNRPPQVILGFGNTHHSRIEPGIAVVADLLTAH
jgi:hypothetical protein